MLMKEVLHNPRAPGIQIMLLLGPKVCKYDLLWAIWSLTVIQTCRTIRTLVNVECGT